MRGYGHHPYVFTGGFGDEDPAEFHRRFAELLDTVLDEIADIKARAAAGDTERPRWPMIVLRTPKGWTCPPVIDGKQVEDSWRSHQVPLASARDTEEHLRDARGLAAVLPRRGAVRRRRRRCCRTSPPSRPQGQLRMSDNPHANGGLLLKDLRLPDFRDFAVDVPVPAGSISEATRVLGQWLTEVIRLNPDNFRIFGPDETASNRLQAVFDATDKQWNAELLGPEVDDHLARAGRVMEMLSEHQCQGWLEGYLLTGRHGLFNCYEAFIHIIDSMFNQHAKWLKVTREIPWRRPVASLNYLLSSHVWRQDHNGFSHQDPGFIDHVVNKKAEIVRVYLPPDANTLLSTYDHCLRSRGYVNVVVSGKQPAPELPHDGAGGRALHPRPGHLGVGRQRDAGRGPGRRPGVRRRRPHPRGPRGGGHPAPRAARPQGPAHQRRRPHAPAGRQGAPARPVRPGLRHPVHHGQAGRVRLPRLPVAHPPPHLPPRGPRQHPRARLQGGGHDDDAVRHAHAQRPRPVPPRHRRHRPGPAPAVARPPGCASAWSTPGSGPGSTPGGTGEDIPEVRDWVWPDAGETGTESAGPTYAGQTGGTAATGGDNE